MTVTNGKPRLLDNLIPLRGDTFGPQLAGWTPGPPVNGGLGCLVWADQMIRSATASAWRPTCTRRGSRDATRPW